MGFALTYRDVYFLLPLKIIINSRSKEILFSKMVYNKGIELLAFF